MVSVTTSKDKFVLEFSQDEFNEQGLNPSREYKITKADDKVWVLIEKGEKKETPENGTGSDVLEILKKKALRDRVEGKFEKFLNEKELREFNTLLENGTIKKFKLSGKYKKAIYKTSEELKQGQAPPAKDKAYENKEKPFPEYTLEKDGFLVVKNEQRAKRLSEELRERIKKNEVRGIKSFDSNFYIIESGLYEKTSEKIIDFMQGKKTCNLGEVSGALELQKTLIQVAIEFLKDDGSVIEKRKEIYQLID